MTRSPRSTTTRWWLAVAAVATLMVTACGGGSGAQPGGELKVGIDLTYPPYDAMTGGEPSGFDVEFIDAVAAKMEVTASYQDVRFAQLIQGLKGNRYDIVASALYVSAERLQQVDMVPYFQTGSSILVPADESTIVQPSDLCGRPVGALAGTVHYDKLVDTVSTECEQAGKPPVEAKEFPTDPEATSAMRAGQVQATLTDSAVAAAVVKDSQGTLALASEQQLWPVAVGIAVNKDNPELRGRIEQAVEAMKTDGTYDELLRKYSLEPVDPAILDASTAG